MLHRVARTWYFALAGVCLTLAAPISGVLAAEQDVSKTSQELLQRSGLRGGLIVHVGCGNGELTAALRAGENWQVHGLERDPALVEKAREHVRELGIYGDVSVDHWDGKALPYVDNLVNLLVIEHADSVNQDEILRVLVPRGVACTRQENGEWTTTVKPPAEDTDEWTHFLHNPSGNAVAHDDQVGPPRHLQWVGSPRWSRHHDRMASMSALVSTQGRLFYVMDEGSRISIQLPSHWKLIARDAYNGTVLWKRDVSSWHSHLWPLKSGPTQLARRLVAIGDEVYATLGFAAPLEALDAATGETLRTYEGSGACEEVIADGGKLFLVVNKAEAELKDYVPLHGRVGDQKRIREEFFWNEEPRVVMAYDAATGKQLWARQSRVAPLTLSSDDRHVYFHDGDRLNAVSRETGDVVWSSEPANRRKQVTFNFGPRLVVHQNVVLFAGGDNRMSAYAVADGKLLWSAEHPNSGYQSPQDLMVVNGLVWCAPMTSGRDTGVFVGRDPLTGDVKQQFAPDVETYWFHHRCYISKATDNFIIPSRTGIEFVDFNKEHWDIHHWVRGGCLYGVMPCNGLLYAPPHNCACYPEAKLFGFNALAARSSTRPVPSEVPEAGRLQRGPAFDRERTIELDEDAARYDWPTFRKDGARSGASVKPIAPELTSAWTANLGGQLTQPVIAEGRVYVAQTDAHTLHVLSADSGKPIWKYTIGARIDSPPTVAGDHVVFGGADGWVYCLAAGDGELIWRYRAAPEDRRTMAFEQLESLWPVHGAVLVQDGVVWCVAGRSVFLDGGLRLMRLDLRTGEKLSETLLDDKNPETGENLQELVKILQMPVGLPDILSTDGKWVFMRSQKFDAEGQRVEIGPVSGDFVGQGGAQRGDGVHLFAPMGFLDDSWFHRSYWVFGRNFAGGHAGYYQAGRFAPSGRILVSGGGYVYGYGRKPEYLRWTTTLEHQLFAASTDPPAVELPPAGGNAGGATGIGFPKTPSLNPQGKPLTVEAWINANRPNGVIIARGGPADGFALSLDGGKPRFDVRGGNELSSVTGPKRVVGEWHHVAGVLTAQKQMRLYVDGQLAAEGTAKNLIAKHPAQPMEIGADGASAVGAYESPNSFAGLIDQVRLSFEALDDAAVLERFKNPEAAPAPATVLALDFNDGSARDFSRHRNNGTVVGGEPVDGRFGRAMKFAGGPARRRNQAAARNSDSFVKPRWTSDVPIYVRGLVLAESRLFMVGPADLIDEEQTFEGLTTSDEPVKELLARQDQVLNGQEGAHLLAVNADTGEVEGRVELAELPVWDGLASARGRLFLSTQAGNVICFGEK